MIDGAGNKIRVTGKDGKDGEDGKDGQTGAAGESGADAVTPMLKIEDGWWYVSYNSGVDWQKLDKATGADGDSFFTNVGYDDKYVYFTLADGTVITIAKKTDAADGEEDDGEDDSSGDTQAIVKGPITLSLGDVTATTVTFNATLDVDMMADYQEVGLIYSQSDDLDVENEGMNIVKINKESYTETFSNVRYDTEYYYTVYLLRNNIYSYGEVRKFQTVNVAVDLSVDSNTQTVVRFKGKIDPSTAVDELEIALLINTAETVTNGEYLMKYALTSADINLDGSFDVSISGLKFNTTYYYTYYVLDKGEYSYGTIQNFKTEDVPVTIAVENIDRNVVNFKGNVQFSEVGQIEIGIQYYPTSTSSQSVVKRSKLITDISENGDFTVELSGLLLGTEYYWQYYLLQNGEKVAVGLPQILEIADWYNIQSELNLSSATDLSAMETANSYIISAAGLYKFKTVKGNSTETVGSVASASILWESFGTSTAPDMLELIGGVCCGNGYIAFQTAEIFKEGNAVIAAKDASGNILWSWHIWFTDPPQAQVYYYNAGTMMDRNLGATSATPGDVGTLGLLYQWGRKDPFLGSSSISNSDLAESTITWPSEVSTSSSRGTVDYVTSNPTTFVTASSSPYDWHYSSRDNTLWTTSESAKSIYDPCPAGWRVPDGGSDGVWSKAGFDDTTYYSTNEGMSFSITSPSTTWYPASGCRYHNDGSLSFVGNYGYYWSASPDSIVAYGLYFNYYGDVFPSGMGNRARGSSVRCLQE